MTKTNVLIACAVCSAFLLPLVYGCAPKSPYELTASAKAVRADSTESPIGKTIIVSWKERVEACPAGHGAGSERCSSDESVQSKIFSVGPDQATFFSADGAVIEEVVHNTVSTPAEGVRHKSHILGNTYMVVTWMDEFDAHNRSRTVYEIWGDSCTVKKPDILQTNSGRTIQSVVELISCEVIAGTDLP